MAMIVTGNLKGIIFLRKRYDDRFDQFEAVSSLGLHSQHDNKVLR
jgi:hypothetical protein